MSRLPNPTNQAVRLEIETALFFLKNAATKLAQRDKARGLALVKFAEKNPQAVAEIISEALPERFKQIESNVYGDNFRTIRRALQRIIAKGQLGTMTDKEIGDNFRNHFKRHGNKWVVVPSPDWERMDCKQYGEVSVEEWKRVVSYRNDYAEAVANAADVMNVPITAAKRLNAQKDQMFADIF